MSGAEYEAVKLIGRHNTQIWISSGVSYQNINLIMCVPPKYESHQMCPNQIWFLSIVSYLNMDLI